MRATNFSRGRALVGNLRVADGFWRRLKGLLGRKELPCDEGLLLTPCNSVHTFGMRFPIDVVFLGRDNKVIAVRQKVPPNRVLPIFSGVCGVLELPAGRIAETATGPGDVITIEKRPGIRDDAGP